MTPELRRLVLDDRGWENFLVASDARPSLRIRPQIWEVPGGQPEHSVKIQFAGGQWTIAETLLPETVATATVYSIEQLEHHLDQEQASDDYEAAFPERFARP